jgi:hypothetical protein
MFDKVTFFYPFFLPISDFGENEEMKWKNIILKKGQNKRTKQIFYEGYYKNMRLARYETGLYVSNSVSTFIYNHNANDITHKQLTETIERLCKIIGCSMEELQVKGFEFGFTLKVDMEVRRIIRRLISHRTNEAKQEYRATKLTSAKFFHHNYTFKVYDKGFVEKLERVINMRGQWIRIEEQFKYKQIPEGIKTAKDLIEPINIQLVFTEFVKQWRAIKKAPFINHSKISKEELYRIYALLSPIYIEDRLDYKNEAAIKKELQRFKRELEGFGDYSIFKAIESDFTVKFRSLMASEFVPFFPALLLVEKERQNLSE